MKKLARTIIIDAQLFQSYTFHRGMGKYSLSLLDALSEKLTMYEHKILVFNNISGYLSDEQMDIIKIATDGFSYEYLDFKLLNDPSEYHKVRMHNKSVLDEYIERRLDGHVVDHMILSLFQETEVSVFPTKCNNRYVLVYDLIPLQFFVPYLQVEHVAANYLSRFDTLMEADHFFTISGSVASDLSLHIGVPKQNITPIYGAPVQRLHLIKKEISSLKNSKIILLPSGDDYRKNNLFAVDAFEKFNKAHSNQYKLVITSAFTDATRMSLEARSKNVVFMGNVSEAELAWLYDSAHLVFFPSQSEGLGLPILEAIEFGKRVVCSDIPAFKEIGSSALYLCDPYKVDDMAAMLDIALQKKEPSKHERQEIMSRYNWDSTAELVSEVLRKNRSNSRVDIKKKIAVFSPKPSGFSGIGKVVQDQHYEMSRIADVTYFFENGITERAQSTEIRKNYLKYAATCKDPWSFDEHEARRYDQVIYHIGNGEYHIATLIKALAFPDQVVLHDSSIKGLYGVARNVGVISNQRYEAEEKLSHMIGSKNGEFLTSLINKQRRVVTHSEYAYKAVKGSVVPNLPGPVIVRVKLAIPASYFVNFNKPEKIIYVSMAGVMTESKGIELADAVTAIRLKGITFKVKIFGFSMLDDNVAKTLMKNKNIELIQSPSDTRYLYELSQTHIMLNFRSPYHGETSYSTLEGLRFGKDVIVNDMGWFSELPGSLVHKIRSNTDILDTIKYIVKYPSSDEDKKNRVRFIEKDHNIIRYVHLMVNGNGSE